MATPPQPPVVSTVPVTPKKVSIPPIPPHIDTPVSCNENGVQQICHTEKITAEMRYARLAVGASKFINGPMPVTEFLSEFLPSPPDDLHSMPDPTDAFRDVPEEDENKICGPLVNALNNDKGNRGSRCPGFVFMNTSKYSEDHGRLGSLGPNVCVYADGSVPHLEKKNDHYNAHFGYAEIFIVIKSHSKLDFCTEPEEMQRRGTTEFVLGFQNRTTTRATTRALGQNVAYAVETFTRQHRAFCFSVSLSGPCARLIRWDHAGATVSAAFDLREQPELLCQFFWRFAHANDEERGYDSTVDQATVEEEHVFREVITSYVAAQRGLAGPELTKAVSEHYEPKMVHGIAVVDKDGTRHRLLVSRPVISPHSVASRATRGYWAVDTLSRKICFLKDTWRDNVPNAETEGDVLEHLHRNGVQHVPSLLYHGDARYLTGDLQHTTTDRYRHATWAYRDGNQQVVLTSRMHYRLVLGTVGYPLRDFTGSDELLHATYDAYEAMTDAFTKTLRIHRDISLGNIILVKDGDTPTRRGFLIDWELSCKATEKGVARDLGRTGTWQFMSVRALSTLTRGPFAHTVQDDMESMLYLILYCSLLWLPHNKKTHLRWILKHMFDARYVMAEGHDLGGEGKNFNQFNRNFTSAFTFDGPIHQWLQAVMALNHPLEDEKEEYGGKWDNHMHLKGYWKRFLEENVLSRTDKTKYTLPNSWSFDILQAAFGSSSTHSSKRSSTKRDAEEDPAEEPAREPKRLHVASPAGPSSLERSK